MTGPRGTGTRWAVFTILPRGGPVLVSGLVAANVALGLLPIAFVVATSALIGRVADAVAAGPGSPAWHGTLVLFGLASAAFAAQLVLAPVQGLLGDLLARRVDGEMFDELMAASLRPRGITPLEDQEVLRDLRTAADDLKYGFMSPGQACAGMLALTARYLQLIGYALVVAVAFAWWAAVALVIIVLLFRHGQHNALSRFSKLRFALNGPERRIHYLRELGIQPPAGKEIRIFGLAGWIADALERAYRSWLAPLWVARRRLYLRPFLWYAAGGLLVTGAVFAAVGASAAGGITVTAFALAIQAALSALRLAAYYPEADLQIALGGECLQAVRRVVRRIDTYPADADADDTDTDTGTGTEAAPAPSSAIHFDHVSFTYPAGDRPVLDDLDLTIPARRCTAIVGLNGAGKTTLVKLLTRLYEPSSGTIRADGADIRRHPVASWRRNLAVIFQDFAHFDLSAAANIGYGAPDAIDDRDGIRAAAAAAGIATELERLPDGLDTPLTKDVPGGTELSGGQWQRVALARALFALRHGTPIVVLDEPTASLDVRAEARFFDEFAELMRGATTLLISHRFSTVRRADHIVVLAGGRVAEQGSHDELMARDGEYARLFHLQADRFTDEVAR
ncbi:multidrug ABC transporter permease [Actinoplanes cyaneus]|uniref:Multidrug ABC transporter permease n=1 Tax=Actinoplanes cyaneus TaxID=52696 RepID=A0A919IVH7_9ACTN|nr:ABC transporter ATP-binding protein/permease [Actinoplanes cyaneus]MCW2138222.1 ATP-binding cassette, subfamily B [Actinoplanes cyaneus]GID70483.1 multidrug ABC transporter permease [Actinoplanes cyaneus]